MSGSVSFLVFRSGCSVQVQFGCETKFYAKVIIASLVLGMVRVKCRGEGGEGKKGEHILEDDVKVFCCLLESIVLDNVGVLFEPHANVLNGKKGQSKKGTIMSNIILGILFVIEHQDKKMCIFILLTFSFLSRSISICKATSAAARSRK